MFIVKLLPHCETATVTAQRQPIITPGDVFHGCSLGPKKIPVNGMAGSAPKSHRAKLNGVRLPGYSLLEPWLVAAFGLYLLAFACWVPVVWLQIKATRLAETSASSGAPLGADYRTAMRLWFALGWPAFLDLMGVFWLMVAKPAL